ncbi:hypothetical protein PG996_000576 [Apiospora saccharicola]|uniref:Uncharacterized protein n=1 Tax=Apiospora saccharicola TaxID=335842 RepID=A0ABR1WE83_9PEZI
MRMPSHKIAVEGTTASLNFWSAAPADLVSLASEAASPSIRYDTNRLRPGQPLTDRPWVVPWIAEDLPESSLSSTGSPGRPVGCRMKKAWFSQEIETPAPEDSAGFVMSALPVPGLRGEAKANAAESTAAGNEAETKQAREDEGYECDSPACRTTHEGHRPFRHSVSCALYRSSQDEDVQISPRGGVDERSRKLRGSTRKSKLAEQSSADMEALHSHHDTVHRQHSVGFHSPNHIAEHLALATGRNHRGSHGKSAGEIVGQPAGGKAATDSDTGEIDTGATDQYATRQLEPLTQVQTTTKVDSFRYKEETLPHGHPQHEEHRDPTTSTGSVIEDNIPEAKSSKHHESRNEAQETLRTLRHVRGSKTMRDAVGKERSSPSRERDVPQEMASKSPLRVVKRMDSGTLTGQDTTTGGGKSPGTKGAHPLPAQEAKGQEKTNSQADTQVKTKNTERTTKHTERTTHEEAYKSSRAEATRLEKAVSTAALDVRSNGDRQSQVSDERIAFNGQKQIIAPKGRIASPPPWLKTPSKKPASVQGRLRPVDTRSQNDLSRTSIERSRNVDRPSSSSRSHDDASKKTIVQSSSEAFQRTKHTQGESETWLGLPSELQQQKVTDKSPPMRSQPDKLQEVASISKRFYSSFHEHECEHPDGCIFCEAPSPTPPQLRVPDVQNIERETLSPSIIASPSHATKSVHESYRRATLLAEEELERLLAETRYSSNRQRTAETRATASGFTATPVQQRQVTFRDEGDPSRAEVAAYSDYRMGSEDVASVSAASGQASDLEIHRPTPIAPPNHDCRWKDRYMELTSEIRQLKAEMSTRVSFHDVDAGSAARGQDSQQQQQQDEDLGIQGLTIVMHLKGKDDLVINTDLTQEAEEVDE